MYIKDSFRLNRFQNVRVPKPREYFARYGYLKGSNGGYIGSDEEPIYDNRKTSQLELGAQYDAMMQKEADKGA